MFCFLECSLSDGHLECSVIPTFHDAHLKGGLEPITGSADKQAEISVHERRRCWLGAQEVCSTSVFLPSSLLLRNTVLKIYMVTWQRDSQ